jgi:hypothetical protein
MIKLVYCLRRRNDVEPEEFYRYWLNDHGPLVKSVAEAIGASKYVQSHTSFSELNDRFQQSRDLAAPYDGITEVWWKDKEALEAGMSSADGLAAHARLKEDEVKFIDFSQSRVFMSEEHLIFDS